MFWLTIWFTMMWNYYDPWPLSPPSVSVLHNTGHPSAAAVCEWALVMLFFCLFGLFTAEFRHIDFHHLTVQKQALENDCSPAAIEVNGYVANAPSWTPAHTITQECTWFEKQSSWAVLTAAILSFMQVQCLWLYSWRFNYCIQCCCFRVFQSLNGEFLILLFNMYLPFWKMHS